jgi:hypothetical protein
MKLTVADQNNLSLITNCATKLCQVNPGTTSGLAAHAEAASTLSHHDHVLTAVSQCISDSFISAAYAHSNPAAQTSTRPSLQSFTHTYACLDIARLNWSTMQLSTNLIGVCVSTHHHPAHI